MRIKFSDAIKASIDSLNDKIKPVTNQYRLVVRGSQIHLRMRLERYPAEAESINALLNNKDLDIQLEPISVDVDNEHSFHQVTQLMQENLTKGKNHVSLNQTTPTPSLSASDRYAHLPKAGIKKGKQNMLDGSVQRYKIEACMNIDQKTDASGNVLYLNKQHQHDVEVTYLEHNLIVFYHMDTMDLSNYFAQNSMAFRLKKCLSPEVKNFKTLLDEPTAQYVQKLFEDPKLGYAKSKIMGMLQKHYKKDTVQAEREICELYQKSIQHAYDLKQQEVNSLSKRLGEQHDVVLSAITYIEENSEQAYDHRQRLSHIMSSSSSPTLARVQAQVALLDAFKNEVMNVYDKVETEKLRREAVQTVQMVQTALPSPPVLNELSVAKSKSNPKKKTKLKSKSIEKRKDSVDDLDAVLNDAKTHYPERTKLERYIKLANTYRAALDALAKITNVPESNLSGEKAALMCSSLMLELINAVKKSSAPNFFMDFKNFYFEIIQSSGDERLAILNSFKSTIKSSEIYLKAIHDFMVLVYIGPEPVAEVSPSQLKKAAACLRNHRETKEASCDLVVRSLLNLVVEKPEPVRNFINLYMTAVSLDMKSVMVDDMSGNKLIDQVQSLLNLYCRGAIYQYFKSEGDLIEIGFFSTLAREIIEHKHLSKKLDDAFFYYFIKKAITSFVLRKGPIDKNNFRIILSYAGIKMAKRIFSSDEVSESPVLVATILTNFSHLIPELKSLYSILSITVPCVSGEFKHSFQLEAPNVCAFSENEAPSDDDIKYIVNGIIGMVSEVRKNHEEPVEERVLSCYDLATLCLNVLLESPDVLYAKKYKKTFTQKLIDSETFMRLAKKIADHGVSAPPLSSPDKKELIDAIVKEIIITDRIELLDFLRRDMVKKYELSNPAHQLAVNAAAIEQVIDTLIDSSHPQANRNAVSKHGIPLREEIYHKFISLMENAGELKKLSTAFMRNFIENTIKELMRSSSPLVCSASTQSAIDSVLHAAFGSTDCDQFSSLRGAVLLYTRPSNLTLMFNILMLCTPSISATTAIPFACTAPFQSDFSPANSLGIGVDQIAKANVSDAIEDLIKYILDIRAHNVKANHKAQNMNLDAASIAIRLLSQNIHLLYDKNFNENFYLLLCSNNEYLQIWKLISSVDSITEENNLGGGYTALYEVYKQQFINAAAQRNNASKQNSAHIVKL